MCGIAGAVGRGTSEDQVRRQLSLLEHRGPDANGLFHDGAGTIGQTRLAIIDLVTGDPPMTSEDATIGAVLNGEVYNYGALREQLHKEGHTFSSHGDTEVIAHLAERCDPVDVARHLDGMFAFAVWNGPRQALVLGRDRVGKKPLYYWSDGEALVFASEIKALIAHPLVPCQMAPGAIGAYLTFGYVPTPGTFFEDVFSVPPAHVLVFTPGTAPQVQPYWRLLPRPGPAPKEQTISMVEAAASVRTSLTAAVERRLISDVPLGAFLSGGVDSSSIVALMASLMDRPVATFTIGFEGARAFDERPYARMVADRFHTDHHEFVVKPEAATLIERLVWHHDQPFGDSSALPTFLLSELTRKHVKVALCGDGGDEAFGGYERFAACLALSKLQGNPVIPGPVLRSLAHLARRLPTRGRLGPVRRFLLQSGSSVPDALASWVSYIPRDLREALYARAPSDALEDFLRKWDCSEGGDLLSRVQVLTVGTYLLDDLLPKVDRTSMAHGLEVRSPFLDTHLLEMALELPAHLKIQRFSLKKVLKAAMADLLPAALLERRKHGFALPLDDWFRGELQPYLAARLLGPDARLRHHLEGHAVEHLVTEHLAAEANHGHVLWSLATLEEFLRMRDW